MARMKKTTVLLPTALKYELEQAAQRDGRPTAELIREAIGTYLAQHERPRLAIIASGEDRDLAARDSEDWLHREWAKP